MTPKQLESATKITTVNLPIEVVLSLLEFSGRATLTRQEWRYLEVWEENIRTGLAKAEAQTQPPIPVPDETAVPALNGKHTTP